MDEIDIPMESHSLVGVHGWLWWLAWSLLAIGPLVGIFMTASKLTNAALDRPALAANSNWWKVEALVALNLGLIEAFGIVAGALLLLRFKPSTPYIVIGLMVTRTFVPPVVVAALLQSQIAVPFFNPFTDSLFHDAIRFGVQAIVWSLYLLLSVRVKNTYGRF